MNSGALPLLLMFAAIGLALTSISSQATWLSIASLWLTALLFAVLPTPETFRDFIILGFWLSMIVTSATAVLRDRVTQPVAIGAAINAGAWSGAFAAASDMPGALAFALPLSLLFVIGRWFEKRGYGIVPKVLSSWLIAVGALATFVSLVPTPGYELDHME